MTRLFIACLGTETNTFVPFPTGRRAFEGREQFRGDATRHPATTFTAPLHAWRARAEAMGWQVHEGLATFAQPSGITVRAVYESLRDELLDNLRAAMPVDVVLLSLHGAMVADGYDDCEGDLLGRVREIVGPDAVIGGELDPHCHLTEAMLGAANHLVMFKEYPHIDSALRAEEVFAIAVDALGKRVKPVMAMFDCRMLGVFRTPVEPMKGFVARMQSFEGRDGILSVSLGHSFPWADVADVGARMLVVADNDPQAAAALAEKLGMELFAMREQTLTKLITPDQLVEHVLAAPPGKPIVAADTADNAGGGSPSDATFILQTLLDRKAASAGPVLLGLLWDPMAFAIAEEAGVGAALMLRLGGKSGPISGDPIDLQVTVRQLAYDGTQSFGKSAKASTGNLAWLQTEQGIDIVVNTNRTQLFDPDAFDKLGLDCGAYRLIVVKSTQHFYAGFAPIASEVLYVTAPGGVRVDFVNLPLTKRKLPYWPKVANPFAAS
ncbi:MAG: M81 family metallopeptidase [Rhizobacter sp.]|nr:M81 family metallopeptidase [Rhizobacter sp.]